ncbi:gle1 RNA export mediator [Rhodnius prolixus]|uniref:gle1 RNA export mediator n=1 Tax=Rhodnius prolixus TaxID=13249 RepID=UPI003D18AD46
MDEDIDKTGYSKLKTEALCKAFKYCTRISEITIGPEASPCESENFNLETPCSKTIVQRKTCRGSDDFSGCDVGLISEKDAEEERFCAKKLLAELNKFCVIDGQRMKFAKLKKRLEKIECAKQDVERLLAKQEANSVTRLQEIQEQNGQIQNQLLLKQQQLDSSTFISRDTSNKRIQEIKKQEEEQKLREKNLEKKKLYDQIYKNEVGFTNAYSEFLNIITNFKDHKYVIASDVELATKIHGKFISLIDRCKIGEVTPTDVALSSSLHRDIVSISTKLTKEKEKLDALIEAKRKEEEIKEKSMEKELIKDDDKPVNTSPNEIGERVISKYNYLEKYEKVTKYLREIEQKLKPFISDESLRKYRSDCQKAVNLPVNAISPVSAAHLMDKLKKLSTLLQGQYVTVADKRVSASNHPLGVFYCMNLLAEKIVKQGEQVVSSKPHAAFAIAAVTVALWIEFPDFGKLLLAHFYRKCPYLIPAYWEKEEDQTEEEFYKKLGFIYSGGELEEANMFLKRQGGIVKLYSSIIVTDVKKSMQSHNHPMGLGECWRLLVAFVKLEPKAEISATVLYDILDITGDAMVKAYRIQFHKLLHVICKSYLPKIVEVTPDGMRGGPLSRLKTFLESIAEGKMLQPPKGLLPPNFW